MIISLLFIIMAFVFDFFALLSKGRLFSLVFAVSAMGSAVIAFPLLLTPSCQTISAAVVNTPSGPIVSDSYVVCSPIPDNLLPLSNATMIANIFGHVGFVVFVLLLWITEARVRRYK